MAAVVATPQAWHAARKSLLQKEKDLTHARAALAQERRQLPIYPITVPYQFTAADNSRKSLSDLFAGRRQLIVYHFMFDPDSTAGCSSCSFLADNLPHLSHLHSRDTTFVAISRAPIDKIEAFKTRMGWTFPWYSSSGCPFNYDFHVTIDESKRAIEYNFADKETLEKKGARYSMQGEQPGLSCFVMGVQEEGGMEKGMVYHTNSTYARGLDELLGTYHLLDQTLLGRLEGTEGVAGFMYHDEYKGEEK